MTHWLLNWSITLGWRDLVTIVSLLLAIDSYRRLRREKAARTEARHQLLREVAANAFHNLASEGFELEAALAEEIWDRSRERADRLRLALAEASGSWAELLFGLEKEKADAASVELAGLQGILHICAGNPPSPEQTTEMRQRCATVYTLLAEISGKFRYTEVEKASYLKTIFGLLKGRRDGSKIQT